MTDQFGRKINYLRLSVTDECNLRCRYCMPGACIMGKPEKELSCDELIEITRASIGCGINKIRITGGEPLIRPDILEITDAVAALDGITEVCLTTNGTLLSEYADGLKKAGLARLNISLDSLDGACFRGVSRGGSLNSVLEGLRSAVDAGFKRIKINTVLMEGINDHEIPTLAELTLQNDIDLRFIELMPIGECSEWSRNHFMETSAVLQALPLLEETGMDGVARRYHLPGILGTIGLISPLSSHFCHSCNRIRVTSDGKIKPCLHSSEEYNLRGLSGTELKKAISSAIGQKPQRHRMDEISCSGSCRPMVAVGG